MHYLGQHFLKNKSAIKKIIAALDAKEKSVIIEIGPGHGELTDALQQTGARVIALEKDKVLVARLMETFGGKIEIKEGDALKLLAETVKQLKGKSYTLVGNIPYYITGNLLRIISELKEKPKQCILMLQEEVADRIAANPPKMNRLAAITQYWATPRIIMRLGKEDFSPPPQVTSAIISLAAKKKTGDWKKYEAIVKKLFAQPRKTIANNLAAQKDAADKKRIMDWLKKIGINPLDRPQTLSTENILQLTESKELDL